MDVDQKPEEGEVIVHFFTSLAEQYHVPADPMVLPSSHSRYGLSEVVNHLLSFEDPIPFDFLIDGKFLRTSLAEYQEENKITAETAISIEYVLAMSVPEPKDIDKVPDWISDVVALSPSRFLASAYDGSVRLYNNEKLQVTCRLADVALKSLAVAAFDDLAITNVCAAAQDGTVRCCTIRHAEKSKASSELMASLKAASGKALETVAVSEDGSLLASGGWDNEVSVFRADAPFVTSNVEEKRKRKAPADNDDLRSTFVLKGHSQCVSSLHFCKKSQLPYTLLSASWDCSVHVWDVAAASCVCNWPAGRAVTYMTSNPSCPPQICTAHEDGHVSLWDIRAPPHPSIPRALQPDTNSSMALVVAMHPHHRLTSQVEWCQDNANNIASVGHDGVVNLIDPRSPTMPVQSFQMPSPGKHPSKVLCAAWLNSSSLVTGSSDGQVRVFHVGPVKKLDE